MKDDIQAGRWGGNKQVNNYILEANYNPALGNKVFYGVKLTLRSLDSNRPLEGDVAFFLHDTFPSEIEYATASNNLAFTELLSYEAFVVGARTKDGTELELNLNEVKGFPPEFYWK
jgi:hypothetical protein